ncbi:MAG: sensor domain-containing protein [Anaerolineales bacterium]|nr:sensor domain-containing protein [Anaerolineales bacterium]
MKTADELIQMYLNDLKASLKGSDKATIQDALADAEEHLRTALETERAEQEGLEESEAIIKIITEYGEPDEIAQAYQSWETSLPAALAETPAARRVQSNAAARSYPGFFGVFADPRAWGGLVYMLISLVTGTIYFSWAVTGLSTSLGVMILIIGIPITIIFLLSFRGIAFLEGRLVEALLGERMPRRASFTDSSLPWKDRLKILLTGKATWLSIIYMILMLPIGIIYFTVMVTMISLGAGFTAAPAGVIFMLANGWPITFIHTANYSWVLTEPQSVLLSLGLACLGVAILTSTMHIARWIGKVHGKFAKALLVSD